MPEERTAPGVQQLDKLLEHRSRLAACALLARQTSASFSELKSWLEESDGNLGAHMRKLEDAGYISVDKSFKDRKPLSTYRLTELGHERLQDHVAALERLLGGLKA